MAKGANRVLKTKAETRKEKKEKQKAEQNDKDVDNEVPQESKLFSAKKGERSLFTTIFIKAGSIFLILYVWSYLYIQKKKPDRIGFFKNIKFSDFPPEERENDDEDDEAPIAKEKVNKKTDENTNEKNEIPPEEEEDVEVIGDMREEIMGGEIYTVDEILEKLNVKKISDYNPAGEYERNLLKEFRIDREMPENIAKKADYYKPIIERGLKEDERFFVKKINDKKGYGLFANVDILPHEVLGVYTGVIQTSDPQKTGKKYEWYYSTIPDRKKEAMIELRVNAKHEGSALRFVNHSIYYNSRIEYVPYNNQWYILFVSNRFINRGEEITVNYREKTKRMPEKIIDKWDKVEMEEIQKLYDEYMKLKEENEKAEGEKSFKTQSQDQNQENTEEKKASVKEEL
ncbi:hypothetical protein LY90DRAFT_696644 [Neocallimastix californiae]|uniref:SET domain-containing protein n=1 Tax=Neocallimastix californiae TaxID=1754190 RepID=A0A1Y2FVK8_9FUNG|nr:hypothetical protein LY90DRAFT_696644 [Neocallimastix californiae]|eukprot:ORY87226.1 hypothetical protein LY90DRAFT_696644 [Neocallimastix californiae]